MCSGLRSLINICEIFLADYSLQFNPDKCTLLIFSVTDFYFNNVKVKLCGKIIKNVKSESHLGHTFENSYDIINIESIIRDLRIRTNTIINTFRPISWESKVLLFMSQCSSLYGCPLWRLDSKNIDRLCTDWNICCRRILGLHPATRTFLIPNLMNSLPIKQIIMKRIINFFITGINHSSTLISNVFKNTILSRSSHMFINITTILKYLDVSLCDLLELNKYKINRLFIEKSDAMDWRSHYIKELLHVKDNRLYIDLEIDHVDISSMLNFLSTF